VGVAWDRIDQRAWSVRRIAVAIRRRSIPVAVEIIWLTLMEPCMGRQVGAEALEG